MGKTGKALKRRRLEQDAAQAAAALADASSSTTTSPPDSNAAYLSGLVSPTEVAMAVRTLNTLSAHPEILKEARAAELKGLRGAVFDFQRVAASVAGTGNSLTSRISAALAGSRHLDALVLLSEMRLRGISPKLGTLQRWTRDCDAASRADGSFGDTMVLRVLDSILRTCGDGSEEPTAGAGSGPVRKMEAWQQRPLSGVDLYADVQAGVLPAPEAREILAKPFRLLQNTPGPERLPPNHHPALLFASAPSTIPLDKNAPPATRYDAPNIPGAFLLADVLSLDECRAIVGAAEAVGFAPDQPIGDEGASVLAHNLYWLADEDFLETFCGRFLHLLPPVVHGGQVKGINARFRVYRYVPGAIYRPHQDGCWPKSGVDPVTGEYLYDSAPPEEPQMSRLTFLIYLNDAFDNGCTTFFLPSSSEGVMNAYPVKPIAGCALVFPHGDTKGSLLHEGSPVGEGGAKYVIRSEVLFTVVKGDQTMEVEL